MQSLKDSSPWLWFLLASNSKVIDLLGLLQIKNVVLVDEFSSY